jgi:hypothetical protein
VATRAVIVHSTGTVILAGSPTGPGVSNVYNLDAAMQNGATILQVQNIGPQSASILLIIEEGTAGGTNVGGGVFGGGGQGFNTGFGGVSQGGLGNVAGSDLETGNQP